MCTAFRTQSMIDGNNRDYLTVERCMKSPSDVHAPVSRACIWLVWYHEDWAGMVKARVPRSRQSSELSREDWHHPKGPIRGR